MTSDPAGSVSTTKGQRLITLGCERHATQRRGGERGKEEEEEEERRRKKERRRRKILFQLGYL